MFNLFALIKRLFLKCLTIFRYARVATVEQPYQKDNQEKDLEGSMNAELRAHEDSFIHNIETKMDEFENKANFQDCEQVHDEEAIRSFIEEIPKIKLSQEGLIKEIGDRSVAAFNIMIEKNDGYELLEEDADFGFWIKYVETPEKHQIAIMKHTFQLNTTLDTYIEFMKDLELQKSLDPSIDAYETHYEGNDVYVNYLRYKKIMFMDPRDFLYVKYTDRRSNDSIVEISKSVAIDHFEPKQQPTKQCTRAVLLLSGNLVKQITESRIQIITYSECNMKIKLKPVMTKQASKNEIKKMVRRYRDYFNQ